jgi:hypothetical protein
MPRNRLETTDVSAWLQNINYSPALQKRHEIQRGPITASRWPTQWQFVSPQTMKYSAAISDAREPRVCGRIIDSKEAQTKERNLIVCLFAFNGRVGGLGGGRGGSGKPKCFVKKATSYILQPNISHPPFIGETSSWPIQVDVTFRVDTDTHKSLCTLRRWDTDHAAAYYVLLTTLSPKT